MFKQNGAYKLQQELQLTLPQKPIDIAMANDHKLEIEINGNGFHEPKLKSYSLTSDKLGKSNLGLIKLLIVD